MDSLEEDTLPGDERQMLTGQEMMEGGLVGGQVGGLEGGLVGGQLDR